MKCQWESFLSLLPVRFKKDTDRLGKTALQEMRIRLGQPPQLKFQTNCLDLSGNVTEDEISYVINSASKFSPWAAATMSQGFLTARGGHRIGVCGKTVTSSGITTGFRDIHSLCIRVARDYPGIATDLKQIKGSILIIGPPGSGKTTLLRDLIRQRSHQNQYAVSVVDEREELFPEGSDSGFSSSGNMDVLHGCPKREGILMVLRTMGPDCIAVDEITSEDDCQALLTAGWCGVELLATAHAASSWELRQSPLYERLMQKKLFSNIVCLSRDKSWRIERL